MASLNTSDMGDEDSARMSRSMSHLDARPPFHFRWMSQDGNTLRLDWVVDGEGTPKPKVVMSRRGMDIPSVSLLVGGTWN